MNSKLRVIKIVTAAAIVFMFLLVVSLIINIVKISNVTSTENKLREQIAEIDLKIEQNDGSIAQLSSNEYLDWYAREYLNMKGRDEDAFTFEE
ncbi:MAG: hypothetical protein E7350_01995 [Clostridiales bacterium]|nr:hypothetical protein [Clostridiales bacterium]